MINNGQAPDNTRWPLPAVKYRLSNYPTWKNWRYVARYRGCSLKMSSFDGLFWWVLLRAYIRIVSIILFLASFNQRIRISNLYHQWKLQYNKIKKIISTKLLIYLVFSLSMPSSSPFPGGVWRILFRGGVLNIVLILLLLPSLSLSHSWHTQLPMNSTNIENKAQES